MQILKKTLKTGLFSLVILTCFATEALAVLKLEFPVQRKNVVLVSIDGFRPEFYMNRKYKAPTLKGLRDRGTYAVLGAEVIFPSLTYPSHTSIITGVSPGQHGILSNTVFTWETGPQLGWYWEYEKIKVPTLFTRVRAAGLKSASARWPVTLFAKDVDHLVPEIFGMTGYYEGDSFDLTVKYTRPELMKDILRVTTLKRYDNEVEMDFWVAEATAHILKTRKPNFMAVHLANVDHVEHGEGRESAKVEAAVTEVDNNLRIILKAIDLKETCLVITGDHGFLNISKRISPNVLFLDKGWITVVDGKVVDYKVIAHAGGGQAAIYLKDQSLKAQVLEVLRANQAFGYRLIEKSELNRLKSYPEALIALEGLPGFTVSGGVAGPVVASSGSFKGNHGFHPAHPELHTGFVAVGCEQRMGPRPVSKVRLIDIAPAVAKILRIR